MFRIKTDIRQYKCETKDKVEKLIRNWVIRPNDLIYNTSDKVWSPIGEHPAFTGLFDVLDDEERNTPDTVVTARSPYANRSVDDDDEQEDGEVGEAPEAGETPKAATNGHAPPSAEATDHVEEVTQLVERPAFDDSEELPVSDEGRKTDVFEQEEVAKSLAETPKPPEAPDGVEPLSTDEVTTMTERTLDMLKITDEEESVEPPAEQAAEATSEEPADEAGDLEEGDEEDGEVTGVREKATDENDEIVEEDPGDTPVLETVIAPDDEPTKTATIAKDKQPRLGRHDLPEELFATNEISSPEVLDQMKKLDELAELSEPSEPTTARPGPSRRTARVPLEEDSGVDEAWDAIVETVPTEAEDDALDDEPSDADVLRETDEIGRDDDDDDYDDDGDDDLSDPDITPDEESDDFDEDYDDDDLGDDTSEPEVVPIDFVSAGYSIPLPYPVRPTADDIRRGLKLGRASEARKNRTYPLPEPKKLDEIHRRYFDLEPPPPRDRTWAIIMGVMVVISLIVSVVVTSC